MKYILAAVLTLLATTAQAQVSNPTAVEFDSIDHMVTYGDNQPVLTEYVVEFYLVGGTSPLTTAPISRTAVVPVSGSRYRIPFSSLPSYPVGVSYQLRIASRGVGGTSAFSNPSQGFIRPVPVPATPANVNVVAQ